MCLILLANDYHPYFKLVVAANRDEFYKRPTLPANFWPNYPSVLAGKDLEQGGTWMGITTTGRFAALTNYRAPLQEKPNAPSRGHLVCNYLTGDQSAEDFLHSLPEKGIEYNGFNLLAGTAEALYYYSNRERLIRRVEKERMLSSLYIVSPEYGTRSSTILLIDQYNNVQFWERSFVADGSGKVNNVYYEFKINAF